MEDVVRLDVHQRVVGSGVDLSLDLRSGDYKILDLESNPLGCSPQGMTILIEAGHFSILWRSNTFRQF